MLFLIFLLSKKADRVDIGVGFFYVLYVRVWHTAVD